MLQRKYILLVLATFILFSPQVSIVVLAEENVNDSVYQNLKKDKETTEKNSEEPSTVDEPTEETVEAEETETPSQSDSLSVTAFDFIKMFIALGFVLFLVYFLLKFVTKRNRIFQQGQSVINLGGTNLGQNKSIQIVKVGKRVLVVGVGETITFLKEIDDEIERLDLIEEFEQKQEQTIEPKDLMEKASKLLNRNFKFQSQTRNQSTESTSFKEQLNKIKNERTKQLEDVKRKGLNKHE